MKNRKLIAALAVLMLVSLACGLPSIGGGGSNQPSGGGGQQGNVLFQDDFSSTGSGWATNTSDSGDVIDYANGGYRIYITSTQSDLIGNANQSLPADVIIEVDATKTGGSDNNDFGIICRMKDYDNFYFFQASSDGYAVIGKWDGGTMKYLSADSMQSVEGLTAGSATNHLRAECIGSSLKMYANGNLVAQTSDSTFTSGGDVGVMAGTFDQGGVDILFDNFVVTKP